MFEAVTSLITGQYKPTRRIKQLSQASTPAKSLPETFKLSFWDVFKQRGSSFHEEFSYLRGAADILCLQDVDESRGINLHGTEAYLLPLYESRAHKDVGLVNATNRAADIVNPSDYRSVGYSGFLRSIYLQHDGHGLVVFNVKLTKSNWEQELKFHFHTFDCWKNMAMIVVGDFCLGQNAERHEVYQHQLKLYGFEQAPLFGACPSHRALYRGVTLLKTHVDLSTESMFAPISLVFKTIAK